MIYDIDVENRFFHKNDRIYAKMRNCIEGSEFDFGAYAAKSSLYNLIKY